MKKITRASIIGELVDKFSLEEKEREEFLFGESVVPTYDIGQHVKKWTVVRDRIVVTGNGMLHLHTVPDNTRWRVRKLDVMNEAGGNFDIDQVFLFKNSVAVQYLFYDTTAPLANATVNIFAFSQDITMEKGELVDVGFNISNYVAGGYVTIHMLREVEILR